MKTPDISHELRQLVADAAGHYPGLELLIAYGCQSDILSDVEAPQLHSDWPRFRATSRCRIPRTSRTTMAQTAFVRRRRQHHPRPPARQPSVERSRPRLQKVEAAHFFPYTRSLIHWDSPESPGANEKNAKLRSSAGTSAAAARWRTKLYAETLTPTAESSSASDSVHSCRIVGRLRSTPWLPRWPLTVTEPARSPTTSSRRPSRGTTRSMITSGTGSNQSSPTVDCRRRRGSRPS